VRDRDRALSRVRILLADDSPDILDYVSRVLQADYQVIGTVDDGDAVCEEVQGYAGEIVFLTVHEDPDFVGAALGAGGRAYVIKSRMNIDLGLAVKAVLSKQVFVSSPLHAE
jgi:DNA-binding NarL/FixJ family response regulator